jgi:hypothetical protein
MQKEGTSSGSPSRTRTRLGTSRCSSVKENRRLFKALYFVTGNRAGAADLMSDAFLKLWERWDSIGRMDDPAAYLFRVAMNGVRMRSRAARRAARRLVGVESARDPFDEIELREDVRRLLLGLAPRQTRRPRSARHVRLRLERGRTDHGRTPVDRPCAGRTGPGRASDHRQPRPP